MSRAYRIKPDGGITIQCVSCKAKKLLTFEEARALHDQPCCDKCGMPMVAVEARVKLK